MLVLKGFLVWFWSSMFYCGQFAVRVLPNNLRSPFMTEMGFNASEFGWIVAIATIFYGFMQIPAGYAVDKYGARKTILGSCLILILGLVVFSFANSFSLFFISRSLIGIGSASAWVICAALTRKFFQAKADLFLSFTMIFSTITAIFLGFFYPFCLSFFGWRYLVLGLTGVIFVILSMSFIFINGKEVNAPQNENPLSFDHFFILLKDYNLWSIAIIAAGTYIPLMVLCDTWGSGMLHLWANISLDQASKITSLMYMGESVGAVFITFLAQRIKRRKILRASAILGALFTLIFLTGGMSYYGAVTLFIAFGVVLSPEILCFSLAADSVNPGMAATAIGFVNAVVAILGAFFQYIFGLILDYNWNGEFFGGSRVYSLEAYQLAFTSVIILSFLTVILSFILQDPDK